MNLKLFVVLLKLRLETRNKEEEKTKII